MAERDFFTQEARDRVTGAIRAVEQQTAAEVVVQVRHVAGRYRDADYLCGGSLALAVLMALLFAPREFSLIGFPIQTALAFALGAAVSARVAPLRRRFVRRRTIDFELRRAARSAFVDLGVSRTSGRFGLLVLAATFERRVAIVADVGIDVAALGPAWEGARADLERAVRAGDLAAFEVGLRSLGPLLAAQHPHRDDDVDELPDEPAPESAGDEGGR